MGETKPGPYSGLVINRLPVFDAEGKLIGRTGEDPKAETVTAEDRITAGLRKQSEEYKKLIGLKLNEAGELAWQAKNKVRSTITYLNFDSRLKANARLREIRAKIDIIKQDIGKGMQEVLEDEPFKVEASEAMAEIEKVFRGE